MQMPPTPLTGQRGVELPSVPPLAAEIAEMNGVADRLIAHHVADPLGYCRGCELPQGGPMRWPCTLWAVATTARAAVRARSLPRL